MNPWSMPRGLPWLAGTRPLIRFLESAPPLLLAAFVFSLPLSASGKEGAQANGVVQPGSGSATAAVNTTGADSAPATIQDPSRQTIEEGSTAVISVDAGDEGTTYKWLRNGVPIAGGSEAVLVIRNASSASEGAYTCVVTSAAGSTVTKETAIHVVAAPCPGHLTMMSCRTFSGTGPRRLVAGFVVGGPSMSGSIPVLLRASGPGLAAKGVERALPDASIVLRDSEKILGVNRGWGGNKAVAAAAEAVGAANWTDDSIGDSALLRDLPCGGYTAEVFSENGDTGFATAEVFDSRDASAYTKGSQRLVNLSVRSPVGKGPNIPVMTFGVGGTTSMTLLIRGMGPALAPFGIPDTLQDPSLLLYRINGDGTQTWLQSNAKWGGKRYLSEIGNMIGAFPWKSGMAADATILMTVPPGEYLLILAGANGETGVALMELYEVP